MKTFLLVVVGVVGLGLAIRFTINKPKHKPATKPAVVDVTPPSRDVPTPDQPTPSDPTAVDPPTPTEPAKPEPPRIAGSVQISDASANHFATGPGLVYYCEGGSMMAQSKAGTAPERVGDCGSAFDMVADAQGVMFCDDGKVNRITVGADGTHQVGETGDNDCIMQAVDGKYAYFVVPGFEGIENPGVYRVARAGGTPAEKIFATRPKEQYMVAVDDEAVWIGTWAAGTIYKLAKTPGAKPRAVVTGQKGLVSLSIDKSTLYWYAEGTSEVRRRKKAGGAIEVVGHDVDQEPVIAAGGHAYWFEGVAGEDKRLVDLAPGAAKPSTLASGLHAPSLHADGEGVYVSELDRDGIFMFARAKGD